MYIHLPNAPQTYRNSCLEKGYQLENIYANCLAQRVINFYNATEVKRTGIPRGRSGRSSTDGANVLITDAEIAIKEEFTVHGSPISPSERRATPSANIFLQAPPWQKNPGLADNGFES